VAEVGLRDARDQSLAEVIDLDPVCRRDLLGGLIDEHELTA
jgi:hypothetical protein